MIDVITNGNELHVHNVPALEADKMRLIPEAKYQLKNDVWVMPFTRAQAWALSDVFGERLNPDLDLRHQVNLWLMDEKNQSDWRHGSMKGQFDSRLYDYQSDGVGFLDSAGSALLADDMGTGKTVQALVWMAQQYRTLPLHAGPLHPQPGPPLEQRNHLVVCTNSMKYKWAEEAAVWYKEAEVTVIDGTKKQKAAQFEEYAEKGGILIINYEALRLHSALAHWAGSKKRTDAQKEEKELNAYKWHTVTMDEAHKAKDPSTLTSRALDYICSRSWYRLAMTGTPILNNPDDLWAIMRLIAPEEYGSRNNFRDRFCIIQPDYHQGFKNVGLRADTRPSFDRLFMPRFLRRTKEEVLPQLPAKMPVDYRVMPMTTKQAKYYATMKKDMMSFIEEDFMSADGVLHQLTLLRQIASGVPEVDPEKGQVIGITKDSNKLHALLDILTNMGDDSLVVYAESRKLIEMFDEQLQAKGYTTGLVTGAVGPAIRERNVKSFQAGNIQVMLGTLGAGAEGITLTAADTVVLAQQSWSHATNAQAIDRVHRIGQERAVHPIVLVSKGTVDEAVRSADATKQDMLQDLVRDAEALKRALG